MCVPGSVCIEKKNPNRGRYRNCHLLKRGEGGHSCRRANEEGGRGLGRSRLGGGRMWTKWTQFGGTEAHHRLPRCMMVFSPPSLLAPNSFTRPQNDAAGPPGRSRARGWETLRANKINAEEAGGERRPKAGNSGQKRGRSLCQSSGRAERAGCGGRDG